MGGVPRGGCFLEKTENAWEGQEGFCKYYLKPESTLHFLSHGLQHLSTLFCRDFVKVSFLSRRDLGVGVADGGTQLDSSLSLLSASHRVWHVVGASGETPR